MKGYSLQSPQDWELGDRAGGCSRNTPFYCDGNASAAGTADKFDPMPSVQLPADAQNVGTATSADECSLVCLGSCSCTAYSYHQGGCSIWHDKLLNVRQQGNSVLHLLLAAKELQSSKSSVNIMGVIIGAAVGGSTATLVLIFLLIVWMRKGKRYGDDVQGGMGIIAFRYVDLQSARKNFQRSWGLVASVQYLRGR
jgi:hypothetical protein